MIKLASATRLLAMTAVATTLAACKEEDRGLIGTWLGEDMLVEVIQAGREGEGEYLVRLTENPCEAHDPENWSIHLAYGREEDRLDLEDDLLSEVDGFVLSYRGENDMLDAEETGEMLRLPEGIQQDDVTAEICAAAEAYRDDPKAWAKFRDGFPEV
jgi:hypothetical protein